MPGSVLPTGDDARVLVVDDDPAMRQAVCGLLRLAGLLVVAEAGSAHEALELVDRAAPSVVVVQPLLPGSPGCLVLITSRRRLHGLDQAVPLSLDLLPPAEAAALFTRITGARPPGRPGAVEQIIELCGRLPLAIRIAAARLRAHPAWTLDHLADRLRDGQERLAELEVGQRSVAAAFRLSYDQLAAGQQRMFRLLGLHPGTDIDAFAAAALAGTTPLAAGRLLEDLADVHLLEEHLPGRYRFHDLIRELASRLARTEESDPPSNHAARHRLLDYWLHVANLAADKVQPGRRRIDARLAHTPEHIPALDGYEQAMAWLEAERRNLLAAVDHAAGCGMHAHAWQLPHAMTRLFVLRCYHDDWIGTHERALASARHLDDRRGQAETLTSLGVAHLRAGHYDEALDRLQQALPLFRRARDRHGEAITMNNLGLVHERQGRYAEALDHHLRALSIRRDLGDVHGQAMTLGNLGVIHYRCGRHADALNHHRQALPLFRRAGDRQSEARTLDNLGVDYRQLDRHAEAIDHHGQALAVYREIGDRYGEAMALSNLGVAYDRLGRYAEALDHHHEALALSQQLGDPDLDSGIRNDLGATWRAIGRHDVAIQQHRHALATASDVGDPHEQARAHDGIAHALHATEQPARARHHWHCALALYRELGVPEARDVELCLAQSPDAATDGPIDDLARGHGDGAAHA